MGGFLYGVGICYEVNEMFNVEGKCLVNVEVFNK